MVERVQAPIHGKIFSLNPDKLVQGPSRPPKICSSYLWIFVPLSLGFSFKKEVLTECWEEFHLICENCCSREFARIWNDRRVNSGFEGGLPKYYVIALRRVSRLRAAPLKPFTQK